MERAAFFFVWQYKIVSTIARSAYIGLQTRALPVLAHVILKGGNWPNDGKTISIYQLEIESSS